MTRSLIVDTSYIKRDYAFGPHFSATVIVSETNSLQRHESFDELEARSRSPNISKPKFPLLHLPLELRQQILSYLLPYTQEFKDSGRLSEHARNFSAVKKRSAKGMVLPAASNAAAASSSAVGVSNVVWQRGNINILSTCSQLHRECTELIYGTNTFLLFVTYSAIQWRFRWLLPSGLAPSRSYLFLELLPQRYMRLIKRVIVHIDHVDSYTSMIKFGVGAKGLKHGLKRRVQQLVLALQSAEHVQNDDDASGAESSEARRLAKLHILLRSESQPQKSAQDLLGRLVETKHEKTRLQCGQPSAQLHKRCAETPENLEEILEPFGDLRSVRDVTVGGAVSESFAKTLAERMRSTDPVETSMMGKVLDDRMGGSDAVGGVRVCVYGNDL